MVPGINLASKVFEVNDKPLIVAIVFDSVEEKWDEEEVIFPL